MAYTERLTEQNLIQMYRWMVLTRSLEDYLCNSWGNSSLLELPHGSQGQEAIAVGTCYGLRREDQVLPSLRTRGAFLVKGITPRFYMAGAFAKATGTARGKATAHHMGDPETGVLLGSGLIGSSITVAVGGALAFKLQKRDNVVLSFFGDGGAQRGDFHEGLNFAGAMKLPVIFVLENNGYAEYTPLARHFAGEDFASRAQGYGMPGVRVDGNDVMAVYEAAQVAVARARAGQGPTLLECVTYRYRSHCEMEPPEYGRDPEEIERWRAKDPITRLEKSLGEKGILTPEMVEKIAAETAAEVEDAVRFAEDSPYPAPEEVCDDVYAPEGPELVTGRRS